jgi:hypothetical protein
MTQGSSPEHAGCPLSAMRQIEVAIRNAEPQLSPLDMLVARRLNLAGFCGILKALPSGSPALGRTLAPGFASFLARDYPALIVEEEEGLLPCLNQRLLLGDSLDDILRQLGDEHRQDVAHAKLLATRCDDFATEVDTDWPELCESLSDFADRQRRHLVWEDATILPIARDRLLSDDMRQWRCDMERRYRLLTCETD